MGKIIFSSESVYVDRASKAEYVWKKYEQLLSGSVLDVGADKCYLKQNVENSGGQYLGVGFGLNVDRVIDLDDSCLPYGEMSFDTVLCLDTLEHLENIHSVFDEICRVAREYVILSLPNPWGDFWSMLRTKDYAEGNPVKFYGLPKDRPCDRHRWFYGVEDAKSFMQHKANQAGFSVLQFDHQGGGSLFGRGLWGKLQRMVFASYFRRDFEALGLGVGTMWWVLTRVAQKNGR